MGDANRTRLSRGNRPVPRNDVYNESFCSRKTMPFGVLASSSQLPSALRSSRLALLLHLAVHFSIPLYLSLHPMLQHYLPCERCPSLQPAPYAADVPVSLKLVPVKYRFAWSHALRRPYRTGETGSKQFPARAFRMGNAHSLLWRCFKVAVVGVHDLRSTTANCNRHT